MCNHFSSVTHLLQKSSHRNSVNTTEWISILISISIVVVIIRLLSPEFNAFWIVEISSSVLLIYFDLQKQTASYSMRILNYTSCRLWIYKKICIPTSYSPWCNDKSSFIETLAKWLHDRIDQYVQLSKWWLLNS